MPASRPRPRAAVAAVLCSLLFLAGCGGTAKENAAAAYADDAGPLVIGTDGSAESRVVAALYGELLADAGVKARMASTRYSSPADTTRAVAEGRIGLAPAYETATLRALPAAQTLPGNMAATLSMALPPGIDALPPARAENGVVLAVTRATARTACVPSPTWRRPAGSPSAAPPPAIRTPRRPPRCKRPTAPTSPRPVTRPPPTSWSCAAPTPPSPGTAWSC